MYSISWYECAERVMPPNIVSIYPKGRLARRPVGTLDLCVPLSRTRYTWKAARIEDNKSVKRRLRRFQAVTTPIFQTFIAAVAQSGSRKRRPVRRGRAAPYNAYYRRAVQPLLIAAAAICTILSARFVWNITRLSIEKAVLVAQMPVTRH
jgi:hypothetical protein